MQFFYLEILALQHWGVVYSIWPPTVTMSRICFLLELCKIIMVSINSILGVTKSKVWCPPDSNESSKTPEKNSQASWMKLNGWEQTNHEPLRSHWERIRVPWGAAEQGQELLTCMLAV